MPLLRLAGALLAAALRLVPSALRPWLAAFALATAFALSAAPASALLLIEIDKHTQTLTVSRDGATLHRWPVSTGLRRYDTPAGRYTPFRLEVDHFSREWDNAPMPHSIFFTRRGHAIHGTTHLRNIGRPASHGCVRLEPQNARLLFEMVKREGMPNVRIVLRGDTPPADAPWLARRAVPDRAAPEPDPRAFERQESERQESERQEPERRAFGPTPLPRPDLPRAQPGYIGPRDAEREAPPRPAFGPAPWERPAPEFEADARGGYWLVRPDGSRVFVDRERAARPAPPPPWFGGQRQF